MSDRNLRSWPLEALGAYEVLDELERGHDDTTFAWARSVPLTLVRAVVVGQDPYLPKRGPAQRGAAAQRGVPRATGHAFCYRGKPEPSARNLELAIDAALSDGGDGSGRDPLCGPMTSEWADAAGARGLLMLNAALTVGAKPGSHLKSWRGFTVRLMRLVEAATSPLWLLCGKDAQKLADLAGIEPGRQLRCGHPSPIYDCTLPPEKQFARAAVPAMTRLVGALRPAALVSVPVPRTPVADAVEETDTAPLIVAIDGSCRDDARRKKRCGSASVLVGGTPEPTLNQVHMWGGPHLPEGADLGISQADITRHLRRRTVRGKAETDAQFTRRAVKCLVLARDRIEADRRAARPTNNRAEWLAAYFALAEYRPALAEYRPALAGRARNTILLSDSRNLVLGLREWIADRMREGALHRMKNLDIVWATWLLYRGSKWATEHIHSHTPEPALDNPDHGKWVANAIADRYADEAADLSDFYGKTVYCKIEWPTISISSRVQPA
jgi:uracil DNA glycosylase/ribonuclease HI